MEGQRDSWVVPGVRQSLEVHRRDNFEEIQISVVVVPAESCRQKQHCLWSELPVGFVIPVKAFPFRCVEMSQGKLQTAGEECGCRGDPYPPSMHAEGSLCRVGSALLFHLTSFGWHVVLKNRLVLKEKKCSCRSFDRSCC